MGQQSFTSQVGILKVTLTLFGSGTCLFVSQSVYLSLANQMTSNDWKLEYSSSLIIPVYTHTHTLIITLHFTCCHVEIKGNQDFKTCPSYADSLSLADVGS